jgi:hypothetical protein
VRDLDEAKVLALQTPDLAPSNRLQGRHLVVGTGNCRAGVAVLRANLPQEREKGMMAGLCSMRVAGLRFPNTYWKLPQ